MKTLCTFALILFTFTSFSQGNRDDNVNAKIQKLEKQLLNIQSQLNTEKQKTKIVYHIIRSSPFASQWDQFLLGANQLFDDDQFGQTAYSLCAKACAAGNTNRLNACYDMPDGRDKIACIEKAAARTGKCTSGCSRLLNLN